MKSILAERKKAIAEKWVGMVLDTYESSGFFKNNKNRFANPVGCNISESLEGLLEILLGDFAPDKAAGHVKTIIDIRAVQDFSPSRAVAFAFELKTVLRQELGKAGVLNGEQQELVELEEKIDALALMAFDQYMESRERLHRIKVRELESGIHHDLQCPSAILRRTQQETAENKQINRIT